MINKWKGWVGALAVVFLLASCSSTAHIEKDDAADFGQFKTFSWLDKTASSNHKNDLSEQKFKDAIGKELEKSAGWKEVKNRPDVYLSYDVLVERSIKENSNPVYSNPTSRVFFNPRTGRYVSVYYPSRFLGYDRDQREIKEGTVTISMIDSRTDKMVWQGWTTDEVRNKNLTSKEIQNSVRSIFKKFDIAKN